MTFLRAIKGAPASVLWALLFTRRPMTNEELQRWTGYADEALTRATRLLLDLGWISARNQCGPWALADGRQFPLADLSLTGSGKSGSLPSSCSSSSVEETALSRVEQEEQVPVKPEVRRALFNAGIREPAASRLARLPHVTPEFVQAHVQRAAAEGHDLGTAIHRIEFDWIPSSSKRPKQRSVEDRIRRFVEGGD